MFYRYLLFFSSFLSFAFSCVHNIASDEAKNEAKDDQHLPTTKIFVKDEIGTNSDNKRIVQTQKEINGELRSAVWYNSQILFEVRYLIFRLKSCKNQKEDLIKKNDFKELDTTIFEKAQKKKDDEDFGVNSDDVYGKISKENYIKRLGEEKNVKAKLILLKEEVRDQLQRCESL